jgi:hypothetical protein
MSCRTNVLDQIEPEAVVHTAPLDLERLEDITAGLMFIPVCFVEAAANLLTNPALDPFGKIPEFKFCGEGGSDDHLVSCRRGVVVYNAPSARLYRFLACSRSVAAKFG